MIGRQRRFQRSFTFVADLIVVGIAWLAAYPIRFQLKIIPLFIQHIPPFSTYAWMTLLVLLVWAVGLRGGVLNREKTVPSLFQEIARVTRSHLLAFLLFIVATFFLTQYRPSRIVMALFMVLSTAGILTNHVLARRALISRRRAGVGVRRALVVGAGELGRSLAKKISEHQELGFEIVGFLSDENDQPNGDLQWPILGTPEQVQEIVTAQQVQTVFIALPISMGKRLSKVLEALSEEMVDVKIVPDFYQYVTFQAGVEEFEGMPIISINDTSLHGWNSLLKRAFDIVVSAVALVVISPILLVISVAVKLSSPGPIFYTQERMGLDGRVFRMLKFRSMPVDAEKETGAVWAVKDDPRRTKFGAFIRRTSLDELPQFINVLAGNMSLVGPRPERPVFIEQFKEQIPKYMLRHKVKAGITGWAQVNGWRGDTDLSRRIEFDIYYIENWSFRFDLRIMWTTLYKGFVSKSAY
jgi:Undecaprenyl-phosphate glucose phosphotransferase